MRSQQGHPRGPPRGTLSGLIYLAGSPCGYLRVRLPPACRVTSTAAELNWSGWEVGRVVWQACMGRTRATGERVARVADAQLSSLAQVVLTAVFSHVPAYPFGRQAGQAIAAALAGGLIFSCTSLESHCLSDYD